ncbi:MAG: nitrile hydratase subunit beta [Burkholderiales bacterium]|nr:nitrile hydratase subunit beta [Burkholderiales bacterium]
MSSGPHDLGGRPAGPVDLAEHERTVFEQRVDAMVKLLSHPVHGHFSVDALRRAIESLTEEEYRRLGYYERWLRALRLLVVERGLVTDAEIDARIAVNGSAARSR